MTSVKWPLSSIIPIVVLTLISIHSLSLQGHRDQVEAAENDALYQAPRFITSEESSSKKVLVTEGSTKILQCQSIGYPQPEYRWMKDGSFVSTYSREHLYRIPSAERSDAGEYQCYARNIVGTIVSSKINLIVAYMTPFDPSWTSSSIVEVKEGEAAILKLPKFESLPEASISWMTEDDFPLLDSKFAFTRDNNLIILNVEPRDAKRYRARATNTQLGQEETSQYIQLKVKERTQSSPFSDEKSDSHLSQKLEIISGPPSKLTFTRGTPIERMKCISNGHPLHNIQTLWFKDDNIPIERAGVRFSFIGAWNRTLSLLNIEASHAGRYTCKVSMLAERSSNFRSISPFSSSPSESTSESILRHIDVEIVERPRLVKALSIETIGEFGRDINITCSVNGLPDPNITWLRNGIPLSETPNVRYLFGGGDGGGDVLTIKYVKREDEGMFQCVADNVGGQVTAYTWLKVKTLRPHMTNAPQNATVLFGTDAQISCQAEGAPIPNTTWLFNGEQIPPSSSRVEIDVDGSMLISNIRYTDSGNYTCIRSNEAGSVSGFAFLNVMVRTRIVHHPKDTKVILGHIAALRCEVNADKSVPYNIIWYHEDEQLNSQSSYRIKIENDGTLKIHEARASDAGQYMCQVKSPGGDDSHMARLDVIELPYAPTRVFASKVSSLPKTINVTWSPGFDGNSPIIRYVLEHRLIPLNEGVAAASKDTFIDWKVTMSNISASNRYVLLPHLRSSASYVFRLAARNAVGEGPSSRQSNRVDLPQEPPSGPPVELAGSARSVSEIMIQWKAPPESEQNGVILGYNVRYRLFGYRDSPWSYRNITRYSQRSYIIQELITWKDYEIQISAFNMEGPGIYSQSIKVKTKEGTPKAPPNDVEVNAIGSTQISARWFPPDPQKINGINQGYRIEVWKSEGSSSSSSSSEIESIASVTVPPNLQDPTSQHMTSVGELTPYTLYNVTVLCFTSAGNGVKSDGQLVRTFEDYPGPVKNLSFEGLTDRSVTVRWSAPSQPNGVITGYTLRYMVKEMIHTLNEKNITSPGDRDPQIYLNSLKPTTEYTFEVYAFTSVGRGVANVATVISGVKPVRPERPTRLAVSNIEPFSLMLQFTPNFDGNSTITKWIVEASSARNMSWHVIYEVDNSGAPNTRSIAVKNLQPYMGYRLRLRASNIVGPSEPSEPTREFQTLQAPPKHPPMNVTIRAVSATQLRVRWIPLSQSEWFGLPRGYNISFRIKQSASERNRKSNDITPSHPTFHTLSTEDPTQNSFIIDELEEFTVYEVTLQAYNDLGSSQPSAIVEAQTRESTPGKGPEDVSGKATSSTTILVTWKDVDAMHTNGIIEGFKVYYGAKGVEYKYKVIEGNSMKQTTLTELKKFAVYSIQVLAYSRIGDGKLSSPPLHIRTFEDIPGPPSNVSFPDVSFSTARIIWDVPEEPNGKILKYRVNYRIQERYAHNFTHEFLHTDRTFRAVNLRPKQYYEFDVTAQTSLGWGASAKGVVYTTNNRELPQPPSAPLIIAGRTLEREITFTWRPGSDGFSPLRHFLVQYSDVKESKGWNTYPETINPSHSTFTIEHLKPSTEYSVRIQAVNDVGPSSWSDTSNVTKTLTAVPSKSVESIKVTPITRTDVKVQWDPLTESDFNGGYESGGYYVEHRELDESSTNVLVKSPPRLQIKSPNVSSIVINDLEIGKTYEVIVQAYNGRGDGPKSTPIPVYVGEAVPTAAPRNIKVSTVSSTEIRLSWTPPTAKDQNGDLLGYKIFYESIIPKDQKPPTGGHNSGDEPRHNLPEIEVVSASHTSHSLIFLEMYTNYSISILAFNPAGEGPPSLPVNVRTRQGIPGPPTNLKFSDITLNTLRVSWAGPEKRNGEIIGYIVTYETAQQDENFSKQVKQRVSDTFLFVHNLEESVTYTFSVRAHTIDYGPPISGNVTTGPQSGSPDSPRHLTLTKTISSIQLNWLNGKSGEAPILGYYIESRRKDDDKWKTEAKTDSGAVQEHHVSYQNLLPATSYSFRIIAYNKFGISQPTASNDMLITPSKRYLEFGLLNARPFFREPWFLVALAAASIVVIILIVSVLCVKSKGYKYKDQVKQAHLHSSMGTLTSRQSTVNRRRSMMCPSISTATTTTLPTPSVFPCDDMMMTLDDDPSRRYSSFELTSTQQSVNTISDHQPLMSLQTTSSHKNHLRSSTLPAGKRRNGNSANDQSSTLTKTNNTDTMASRSSSGRRRTSKQQARPQPPPTVSNDYESDMTNSSNHQPARPKTYAMIKGGGGGTTPRNKLYTAPFAPNQDDKKRAQLNMSSSNSMYSMGTTTTAADASTHRPGGGGDGATCSTFGGANSMKNGEGSGPSRRSAHGRRGRAHHHHDREVLSDDEFERSRYYVNNEVDDYDDDNRDGYSSSSLTEKPSEISSTDTQSTGSEAESSMFSDNITFKGNSRHRSRDSHQFSTNNTYYNGPSTSKMDKNDGNRNGTLIGRRKNPHNQNIHHQQQTPFHHHPKRNNSRQELLCSSDTDFISYQNEPPTSPQHHRDHPAPNSSSVTANHYANVNQPSPPSVSGSNTTSFRTPAKKSHVVAAPMFPPMGPPSSGGGVLAQSIISTSSCSTDATHPTTISSVPDPAASSMCSSTNGDMATRSAAFHPNACESSGCESSSREDGGGGGQGGSSAVVNLNGAQIIMNNMARSRAPLPGFSSFV